MYSGSVFSPAFVFFEEFGDYCHKNHPGDISLNASTLVRTGVVGPRRNHRSRWPREGLRRRGGLEWVFLRSALRRAALASGLPNSSVSLLCLFPFNRADYDDLVLPFVKGVADAGGRCAAVVPGPAMKRWGDHAHRDGFEVHPLDAGPNLTVYLEARRTLEALRPGLEDVANRFALGRGARTGLAAYFTQFAFQKALAARFLARLAPTVVLGIHFVYSRGWQAAIRDAPCSTSRPTVILVQHGALEVADEFHDFDGADVVMLWGERWRRELLAYPTREFLPKPKAVVTGNPKYDDMTRVVAQASLRPTRPVEGRRVLFVSGHENGRTKLAPLKMAIAAASQDRGFDLIVKPHPASRDGVLAGFVNRGNLLSGAVLPGSHPIQDGVRDADIVIGPESTTLFEAVRIGRPVVLLSESPSQAFEGFLTASDASGLHRHLEALADDQAWRDRVLERQRLVLEDAIGRSSGAVAAGVDLIRSYLRQAD